MKCHEFDSRLGKTVAASLLFFVFLPLGFPCKKKKERKTTCLHNYRLNSYINHIEQFKRIHYIVNPVMAFEVR